MPMLSIFGILLVLTMAGCDDDEPRACANETCLCPAGGACELACAAPPCNVECRAGSTCTATCANGTCACERGGRCDFACAAPPCHVRCAGDNPQCDGTCANGTCACGPDSSCLFTCESGPCHVTCPPGASCVVLCARGGAGTQDCDIPSCAAGAPTICGDGDATTCNAECPPIASSTRR